MSKKLTSEAILNRAKDKAAERILQKAMILVADEVIKETKNLVRLEKNLSRKK